VAPLQQLAFLDAWLERAALKDAQVANLYTAPRIDPETASVFVACVDCAQRFKGSHQPLVVTLGCGGADDSDDNVNVKVVVVQEPCSHEEITDSVRVMSLEPCDGLNPLETYPRGAECMCANGISVGCSSSTCRGSSMRNACQSTSYDEVE
jgi:hypothetical protein